jgi:hypothetical protein
MDKKFRFAEKLLASLTTSPEVKVIIDRERALEAAEKKQARIDCLVRIKNLRSLETTAEKDRADAHQKFLNAQAKMLDSQQSLAVKDVAYTLASQVRMASEIELSKTHGEAVTFNTLYMLDRLAVSLQDEISKLESMKSPTIMVAGRLEFRSVPPNLREVLETVQQRLNAVRKLYVKTAEFIDSEMSPSEISELCNSICKAAGLPVQAVADEVID